MIACESQSRSRRLTLRGWTSGILLSLAGMLSSCMVGPNYKTPEAALDGRWLDASQIESQPAGKDAAWWRGFNDTSLNCLIDYAYENNLSLQSAGVRVLGARANLNSTIGSLFPQQQGIGGNGTINKLDSGGGRGLTSGSNLRVGELLFSSTWEIDFWGKYRRAIEGETAAYFGSLAAYDNGIVTLVADVASVYTNLRTLQARRVIALENVTTQKESLKIAESRFKLGETGELDVSQAKTVLAETQALVPQYEMGIQQAKDALGVLLGTTPGHINELIGSSSGIPSPPSKIAVGVPADLLRQRPDVRLAGLAAAAQSAGIGVVEANLYPSFSLSGTIGLRGSNISPLTAAELFTWGDELANATGSFVMPILNYGRITNQVRVQDAAFQQSVLAYQNTVLEAQREVNDAIVSLNKNKETYHYLREAVTAANKTTELALVKYREGQTGFTTVLIATQSQIRLEENATASRGDITLAAISLYRALGGGWPIRGDRDVVSDAIKEEMANRTNWGRLLEPSRHLPARKTESNASPP